METEQVISLTAAIVVAYVSNNKVTPDEAEAFMKCVHSTLTSFATPEQYAAEPKAPAVSIRASVKPDYLVCLVCGGHHKMLKRHLMNAHGITPDQYRAEYGLLREYSMVASNYSEQRRSLAHSIGLGRRGGTRK